ncbi:MAG: hypothetical protein ACK6A4_04200 [Alphaproteobacteria bacterium]
MSNTSIGRDLKRRTLLKSAVPLLACAAGLPLQAGAVVNPPFGSRARSESVLMAAFAPDARLGFLVRLCRYPGSGVTWAWSQVFDRHQVYSFTDPAWGATRDATSVEADRVQYASAQGGAFIAFERLGSRAAPGSASMRLNLGLHRNPFAPDGPGRVPVTIEAGFQPHSSADGIIDGRSEIKGKVNARIVIAGRARTLVAQGHFHEQQQETPRFVDPFVYFSGWGERINFTLILGVPSAGNGAASSGGIVFQDGKPRRSTGFSIEPPSASRRFSVKLDDGTVLEGRADARYVYGQRIYGAWRPSSILNGMCAYRRMTGMINAWLPDRLPYIPSSPGAATPSP